MTLALAAAFFAGVFLAVCFSVRLAADSVLEKRIDLRAAFKRLGGRKQFSDALQRWMLFAEKGMRTSFLRRRGAPYAAAVVFLALAGFFFGVFRMDNFLAGVFLAAAGVVFPEQVAHYREKARQEKLIEQLGAAVRVFSSEYADTPHPARALRETARKLPEPIGSIFREAERDMLTKSVDEAALKLGRSLGGEYGRMFAQLFRISYEDEAVKPLFAKLAVRVTAQQDLIRKNRLEISMDRTMAFILNAAVVPFYFLIRHAIPEAQEFFTATAMGKGVVALSLLSAVSGALLDRVLSGGTGDE